jgi:hypothetical protein
MDWPTGRRVVRFVPRIAGVFIFVLAGTSAVKFVRLVARPDQAVAPRLFSLMADAPYVSETRLLAWTVAPSAGVTSLTDVHGDGARLAEAVAAEPPVTSVSHTQVAPGRHAILLQVGLDTVALLERILGSLTRTQLTVLTPVVYRDGRVHVRLVGAAEAVQSAVDGLPAPIDVEVRAVGNYHPEGGLARRRLSERQRAALEVAMTLGYYEHPRQATHADVAERLDCAPSTASEHLQRAEAKLVRRALPMAPGSARNA